MSDKKDISYWTDGNGHMAEMEYFLFLTGKAEKLSSALYLVTGFLSDMEPIKWTLRDRSISLLSDITTAEHASLSDKIELFEIATQTVREIVSLIAIARLGRIISEMNADVLTRGYSSLSDTIGHGANIPTSADAFVSKILADDEKTHSDFPRNIFKGQPHDVLYGNNGRNHSIGHDKNNPGQIIGQNDKKTLHKKEVGTRWVNSATERRNIILRLAREKNEITIKDVSSVISGCSEKTLQRELIALVKDNVLKKEGERRWSRYSLR